MTSINIRPAEVSDFHSIINLIPDANELFLIYPDGTFPFTMEQMLQLARERIELTVICDGEEIVGFANLYNHEPGKFAYIGNIYIIKSFRGRGLGKRLLKFMLNIALVKLSLPEVRLSVFADNTIATTLYKGLGFKIIDSEERVHPNGRSLQLLHMTLLKRPVSVS